MNFDSIIIGAGLAGLTCGIKLAESGLRCAIVSRGQSALHFSSGSLDLLSALPDGRRVQHPPAALDELACQAPRHPYSLIGKENLLPLIHESEQLLQRCASKLTGDWQQNHARLTPSGAPRASWLSPPEIPLTPLPWQRVVVINIAGFLDFQAELVAASLNQAGIAAQTGVLTLPLLDRLRNNPSEFRAVNIARVLDRQEHRQQLIAELRQLQHDSEALILPACLGLEDGTLTEQLATALGVAVRLLPTLPPSVLGMRLHNQLRRRFQALGGLIMPGDSVTGAALDGNRVSALFTRNHHEVPLRATSVVLASGSFFSSGLHASRTRISEPVFNLEIDAPADRSAWSRADFFAPQPWLQFGVKVSQQLRPFRDGQVMENVYAIGSVLGGFDPIRQGCGAGVSMLSALFAARQILANREAAQ